MNLQNIPVTLLDRKWMRAAKAWRCFLLLPHEPKELPSVLSAMIETQVAVALGSQVISPAIILDVPHKAKSFQLVIETVYEHQNGIGPYLTAMCGEEHLLTISPVGETPQPEQPKISKAPKDYLAGLHVLFQNQYFHDFVAARYNQKFSPKVAINTKDGCKAAFKFLMNVKSCRDLEPEQIDRFRNEFNAALNGKG